MGDWRTVNLRGSIHPDHLPALHAHLGYDVDDEASMDRFCCLSYPATGPESLCGIGRRPAPSVHADGNLAERNYDVEDVAATLRTLVTLAPSMWLTAHVGGPWEATACEATVLVRDGQVSVLDPQVAEVRPVSQAESMARFYEHLTKGGR
jgi:hypothetical protein